jgi:hypothetical protein
MSGLDDFLFPMFATTKTTTMAMANAVTAIAAAIHRIAFDFLGGAGSVGGGGRRH